MYIEFTFAVVTALQATQLKIYITHNMTWTINNILLIHTYSIIKWHNSCIQYNII